MTPGTAPAARLRPFGQVDVCTAEPYRGNPLVVVVDAEGLPTEVMQQFANWTNLTETTFLLPSTDPGGGSPKQDGMLVQECGAGLVRVKRDGGRLAFAAPPLTRSGLSTRWATTSGSAAAR